MANQAGISENSRRIARNTAFLYIRMWSFRLRLLRDLRTIKQTNTNIVNRINEKYINKQ